MASVYFHNIPKTQKSFKLSKRKCFNLLARERGMSTNPASLTRLLGLYKMA